MIKNRLGMTLLLVCLASPVLGQPTDEDKKLLEGLRLTAQAFRIATKNIEPSLVAIESFGGSSTAAGQIGGIRKQGEGNTTGVMISEDGYIITSAFNFIEQPTTITVLTHDGTRHVAELVGRDDTRRLCLLKIEGISGMPVPEMISPDEVRVGQWAVSVGVGYGDSNPAISMGIISAKNRAGGRAIQTDANISPANYGGPLLDVEGKLIGICIPLSGDSQNLASGVEWYDSGIGFCIPLHGSEDLLERLKQGEHIRRAFLGVQTEEIDDRDAIRVVEVVSNTAAEEAGLKASDILIKVDDQPTANLAELRTILAKHYSGDEIEVVIERDGEEQMLPVKLGAPVTAEAEDTPSLFPGRRRRGPEK